TVVTVGVQLVHRGLVVEVALPPQPTQSTASRVAVGGGQP
ncbi:efflux RND transporter periplasmic adaptor subunit, partial [Pseudomonas aeruginosa]